MKKRLLAAAMTGMMALSAIWATPMMTSAKVLEISEDEEYEWTECVYNYTTESYEFYPSGIPVVLSSNNDNTEVCCIDYADFEIYDKSYATAPEGYDFDQEELDEYSGTVDFWFQFDSEDYNEPGDVLTLQLPFTGTMIRYNLDEYYGAWTLDFGTNTVTFTCNEESWGFEFYTLYKLGIIKAPEGNFWFEPMKNELAIAASVAEATGGTATAKISGDYALSYDIMKYLEDHPGVTLEYTLTYEGEEHLIVIPGGTQLANTEIPWYGPKYLIKYFEQR